MQLATGVDLIEISRIAASVERFGNRFLSRVYTPAEVTICRGRAQSLAGRFAAKEAVSKALGVGIRTLRWRDIEILRDPRGKPLVRLHGKAATVATRQGFSNFEVSITHSRTQAMAMVIAWGEGQR